MVKLIYGDRIGNNSKLRVSATAIVFDEARSEVLLTQRMDNGRWCLPGGAMDPGESAEETCVREAFEETGLNVRVTKLVGIYTSPNHIIEYQDGNQWQAVSMYFEAAVIGGELALSEETTDCRCGLDLMETQMERIDDALKNLPEAFIK
jgi:8-oxo-dGTP pyrophosphatase MutT (NUDIX family)